MLKPKWAGPITNPIIKDQFKSVTVKEKIAFENVPKKSRREEFYIFTGDGVLGFKEKEENQFYSSKIFDKEESLPSWELCGHSDEVKVFSRSS